MNMERGLQSQMSRRLGIQQGGGRRGDDDSSVARNVVDTATTTTATAAVASNNANDRRFSSVVARGHEHYQRQQQNEIRSRSTDANLLVGNGVGFAYDDFEDINVDYYSDQLGMNFHNNNNKKKMRHNPYQIQELEALFKECPHPDENQRKEVSHRLNLDPRQVKFWFQNRRTQMKAKIERYEKTLLMEDNEKLREEGMSLREVLRNPTCGNCGETAIVGIDEESTFGIQSLRIENARLRGELDRASALAEKFLAGMQLPITPLSPPSPPLPPPASLHVSSSTNLGVGVGVGDEFLSTPCLPTVGADGDGEMEERCRLTEVGIMALEELVKLVELDEPLWGPATSLQGSGEVSMRRLNYDQYLSMFPRAWCCIWPKPVEYISEATRATATMMMNCTELVNSLVDPVGWADAFPGMVGRSITTNIISSGMNGTRNGALYVINAELQVISPLVPIREISFLRYSKQHGEGVWAIVDVSIDGEAQFASSSAPAPSDGPERMKCRRLPSGCVIQDMSNGCSKVTWVEHVEYDERLVDELYRPLIWTGMALGAKRWVATLQRHCDFFAMNNLICSSLSTAPNAHANHQSYIAPGITAGGRRSLLKLAKRMTDNFCSGVCGSSTHNWTKLQINQSNISSSFGGGEGQLTVMTRMQSADEVSGVGGSVVLCAATSVWLPLTPPQRVFDFLRDERLRNKWDVLSNGGPVQEIVHIPKSHSRANAVSLFRPTPISTEENAAIVNANTQSSNMLILQETCTDASGSLVVYSPVYAPAVNLIMNGGDSDQGMPLSLLPTGFAILPDGEGGDGSLLTVAFQFLVNSQQPNGPELITESVKTASSLISETVCKIRASLPHQLGYQ